MSQTETTHQISKPKCYTMRVTNEGHIEAIEHPFGPWVAYGAYEILLRQFNELKDQARSADETAAVRTFYAHEMYTSLEMLPADARLCAAAPDLLAVLRDARERMLGSSPAITALRKRAEAAIAKAEGRS
jgi:hypothetical protein